MISFKEIQRDVKAIKILCIGDVLLDKYIIGNAQRLSPEAPVPILQAEKESNKLGGAGNVVRNLASLGISCFLCGLIGEDKEAEKVKCLLDEHTVCSSHLLSVEGWGTIRKIRFMAESKHLLRVDFEEDVPLTDQQIKKLVDTYWKPLFAQAHILLLSDYEKGLLRAPITKELITLAQKNKIPIIVDPKGNDFSKYTGASIITPNKDELSLAAGGMPVKTVNECIEAAQKIFAKADIKGILVTRGAAGMAYITKEGLQAELSTKAQAVHDVSGAGDTVVAMMATGIALGWPIKQSMELATICAGIVVGKVGTAVVMPEELAAALSYSKSCIMSWEDAERKTKEWKNKGLTVGFTNGCFDILHKGHLSLLDFSKSKCDKLIVGMNSDKSVQKLKGDTRPIQDEYTRTEVLSSLNSVDGVVLFEEKTPYDLINKLQPDVLIKGQDYKIEEISGSDIILQRGGKVHLAPLLKGYSTTNIIKKIS